MIKVSVITSALTLCALLGSLGATAEEETLLNADKIVANVNARDEGERLTRQMTMELIDKRGKSRVRETFGFRKFYGEEKRSVIFFTSPANIKDTGFLTFDYPDVKVDDDQWLYLPAARKVRRISSSDRGDYFLGTDFSYDDMKKESKIETQDFTFKTLGEEVIDGHHCYIIEGIPVDEATAKELGYGKVNSWIDSEIWMVRKGEFWDIRMNPLKVFTITDIRKVDDIWTPHKLTVVNHKTKHQSRFTFSEVDYEAEVDDDVFTKRSLERGVRSR